MDEFLAFRKFVTPIIIQVLFWVGVAGAVIGALVMMFQGTIGAVILGLIWLVIGPLFARIYCELLILLFRIYDELVALRTGLPPGASAPGFPVMSAPPMAHAPPATQPTAPPSM